SALRRWLSSLPTAAKLLLILSAALLPVGISLVMVAADEISDASDALRGRTVDQAAVATRGMESLVARNALALRIAANAALSTGPGGGCERARASLTIAPAVARDFELEASDGTPICKIGEIGDTGALPLVAPGSIRVRVAPDSKGLVFRVGVNGGMATGGLSIPEIENAAHEGAPDIDSLILRDDERVLTVIEAKSKNPDGTTVAYNELPLGNGDVVSRVGGLVPEIRAVDRLLLLMPVLMWVMAALITWVLVTRLLIRPLKQLQRSVAAYQPGEPLNPPRRLGPATEIRELRDAFQRAFAQVEDSERDMSSALDGQRRLVREVHHRVKNNLQVVASLLNIHGRSARTIEARAAYAGIGRRVGALSIVHRNHFAEMEENRGIALRPLLTELAAELRAGAPDEARGLIIDLELDSVNSTQDVAVAVAFLITEIVEFAMLNKPLEAAEVSLRRIGELTARLTISSPVLVPDEAEQESKVQFERIISGLAKQLRSPLERKLGRYSVDLPIFPEYSAGR
ncbi:MAG: sensor histidine kinase, partial [Sphingomicrobium sp.]